MKFLTAILSALALAVSTTSATPIDAPTESTTVQFSYPTAQITWASPSTHHVKWNFITIAPGGADLHGILLFMKGELEISQTYGIQPGVGSYTFDVPHNLCTDTYHFELFSSENEYYGSSPEFTIEGSRTSGC